MSFASASLGTSNYGNIGQIFTGTSAGVTNVADNVQTNFASITVPPGTYILGYNYSIFDVNINRIYGITMQVNGVNYLSYYVDRVVTTDRYLIEPGSSLSGGNTIFVENDTDDDTTYTVSIILRWDLNANGPSVCTPNGGVNQSNYIYCLKVA